MQEKCGFNGTQPYWDWSQNTADFLNDPIFDSSPTGFGTNGDPEHDLELANGGFAGFALSYPVYHPLRRNFTLQPWLGLPAVFYLDGEANPGDPTAMANSTFNNAEVTKLVEGYVGNFSEFQKEFESFEVRFRTEHFQFNSKHFQQGPHSGVHLIFGGCVPSVARI